MSRAANSRPRMRISIQFCRLPRRILWPTTCAVWSRLKNSNMSQPIGFSDRLSPYFKAFPQGYYLQGATKLGLGQFAPAEQILGKYVARVHDDSRAVVLMANAALAQHGAARAIDYLKPLVETA